MGSVATGPNGNTLFIPYAGSRGADEIHERDYRASLYSGDMGTPSWEYGYKDLDILNDGRFQMDGCRNWVGQSIRPVYIEVVDEPQIDETFGKVADVVDLGLSVKWASWNVGASKVADYGGLYGAGDPTGVRTNYSIEGYHRVEGECISGTEYDLATLKWGKNWRIPTIEQLKELKENCTWEKEVVVDGIKGVRATGPNGNQIFIPCAGTRQGTRNVDKESIASVWSGDITSSYPYGYQDLDLYYSGTLSINGNICFIGQSIRPVYVEEVDEPQIDEVFGKVADVVDLGLSVKWSSWNVGASKVADYGGLYGAGDPTGLLTSTNYFDYYWKDGESICGTEYDLAHVKWGDKWQLPTIE